MTQKRKAISPIIATLILIVITVVAGIALYGFVSGYMGTLTSTTSSTPPNVQVIAFNVTTGNSSKIDITLFNAGSSPVTLSKTADIFNATSNNFVASFQINVTSLAPNTSYNIGVSSSNKINLASGNYYVKITTTNGYIIQTPSVYGN
ncbi:MAG: archaellin/type IV pilin N-terminal domain-containing protein [Nitrososphaeria archaeon]